MRRVAPALALAALLVVVSATPALADPARPSSYSSHITAVTWEGEGPVPVEVTVVGGDSFLSVAAPPGVAVDIPGYTGEPYIRIDGDGTVWLNRNSPAYWLNEDRYAAVTPPESAHADAEPDWVRVGSGGEWAWHDHRIHWMTPDLPPAIDASAGSQVAMEWTVPLHVDGTPATVSGELVWHPAGSALPWVLLAVVVTALAAVVARLGVAPAGWLVAAAGSAAFAVTWGQHAVNPPGAGGETLALVAAALAAAAGVAGATVGRRRPGVGDAPTLAGAALLAVWALRRVSGLWLPVLPTVLPPAVDRAVVAAALGVALGVGVVAFMRRLGAAPPVPRARRAHAC